MTANSADIPIGRPLAQPVYQVDATGNPISSTNPSSFTETNSAAIKTDTDNIAAATGAQSDASWSGSGNASMIAALKAIYAHLGSVVGSVSLSAGSNLVGGVNVSQFGGVNTTMATADGVAAANVPEFAIGLYNTSGTVIDRLRDAGSVGDSVTIGLIAAAHYLFNGGSFDRQRTPGKFIPVKNVAVTAGTAQAIWTPGSGKKFHLMGFALSLSVAGYIMFEDGAAGASAEFLRTPGMAAGIGMTSMGNMGNGYASTTANNALYMDVSASGNINGFLIGTEEF